MYDALIIGGGPAGLQAALTLGRMHRRTLLVDSGEYRNARVHHAQNLLTNDGRAPADIRSRARAEIAAYATVEIRDAAVTALTQTDGGFRAKVAGDEVLTRHVILATGLHDELPAILGLAEQWGDRAANCPFCHGHEFAGGRVAVLNASPHAAMQAAMLAPVVAEAFTLDPDAVRAVERTDAGLRLVLRDGGVEDVAGVFVAPTSTQRSPFPAQLALAMQESGAVRIDGFGRTSLPGVFAAGDMAHSDAYPGPLASLASAIAAGQLAAVGVVQALTAAA